MGYITYNTDAFKNNENVMIEVDGESFILSNRMGNAIHNLIIGISNTRFHLKITTDKESYNYDENLTFSTRFLLPELNRIQNDSYAWFVEYYGKEKADKFFENLNEMLLILNSNTEKYICGEGIPGYISDVYVYNNSIKGLNCCTPNNSGFGTQQSSVYNTSAPLGGYSTNRDANEKTNNRAYYYLFTIIELVESNDIYKFSDDVRDIIDNNLVAIEKDTSVKWKINIDGAKNPTISLGWESNIQYDNASVEIRSYSYSIKPIKTPTLESSTYIGRFAYDSKPINWTWESLYENGGTGADLLDDFNKFLQNITSKIFSNDEANTYLFFKCDFFDNGIEKNSTWCFAQLGYYGTVISKGSLKMWSGYDDGSTVEITRQNTDDFYLDFEDNIDNIDFTNYGVSGLSLMTKSYVMSTSRLKQLGNFLWNRSFTDAILDVNQSPIENIVSCKVFPFSIDSNPDTSIVLGNVDTGIFGNPINENENFIINVGNFKIPKKYGNWLDYEMTQIGIFLPMSGFHELSTNEYMNKTLNVKYYIDIITGVCKIVLYADNIAVEEFGGQIGFDIPLTSQNRAQMELAQITSFASGTSSLLSGDISGSIGGFMGAFVKPKANFQTVGSLSPMVNMMTTRDVFLIINRPIVQYPSNYAHVFGFPCFLKKRLNNLKGFTTVYNADLSGVPCTEKEKEIIKGYLERGVIL